MRYMSGCRCFQCRRANSTYENQRRAARKAGDWNGLVPAERARQHIIALSQAGIGRRQVADASCVAESTIFKVLKGERRHVRALIERAILAVTPEAAADRARIDAAPTWHLIDELLAWGYTKSHLALQLGYTRGAIQFSRSKVTVRNAHQVRQLHKRLRREDAAPALRLIAELREEGYRPDRIAAMVSDLAMRMGLPGVDLQVRDGHINAAAAQLLGRLHAEILKPEETTA